MSDLAKRTISRRISRPNGRKAIARIDQEIHNLLEFCPKESDLEVKLSRIYGSD